MKWQKRLGEGSKWGEILPLAQQLRSQHPQHTQKQLAEALRSEVAELPGADRIVELIRKWEYRGELDRSTLARGRAG